MGASVWVDSVVSLIVFGVSIVRGHEAARRCWSYIWGRSYLGLIRGRVLCR
jgi:hypothetical protein